MFWLITILGLLVYGGMNYFSNEQKQLRDETQEQKIEKIGFVMKQNIQILMKILNQPYRYDFQDSLFFHTDESFRLNYYKRTKEILFKVEAEGLIEHVNLLNLNKILSKETEIPIYIQSVYQDDYFIIFTVKIQGDERCVDRLRTFTLWCRTKFEDRIKKRK